MGRTHSVFWRKAHVAGAPYFLTVPCPTCRVQAGDYCTRGSRACQTRIDLALHSVSPINTEEL